MLISNLMSGPYLKRYGIKKACPLDRGRHIKTKRKTNFKQVFCIFINSNRSAIVSNPLLIKS